MAKRPTVTTISSGYASNTQLNGNFEALRDAFDNTLSLDGSTPNAMGADLDMNNNDILNAGGIGTTSLSVRGVDVVPANVQFWLSVSTKNDVPELLADITFTYAVDVDNTVTVVAGDIIRTQAEGFAYEVAASGASDNHVTTAGGVKLYVKSVEVSPEAYGALGDGSDETVALMAMADHARTRGFLNCTMTEGKTYGYTKNSFLANIKNIIIKGNGAKFINLLGTAADPGFVVNAEGLVFYSAFFSNGPEPYDGSNTPYNEGQLIDTVTVGSVAFDVAVAEGLPEFAAGDRVLVYGFDCQNDSSFPPCAREFEWATVESVLGQTVTLTRPLTATYRDDWDDGTGGVPFGPARVINLTRGADDFEEIESLYVENLEVLANPAWTHVTATENRNGRIVLSGFRNAVLNNVKAGGGVYLSAGENITWDGGEVFADLAADKLLSSVHLKNMRLDKISEGIGTRNILSENCKVATSISLGALESVRFIDCDLPFNDGTTGGAMTPGNLTPLLEILGGKMRVTSSAKKYFTSPAEQSFAFTAVDENTLSVPLATYQSNDMGRSMQVGLLLTNDGEPAFRVGELPYVSGTNVLIPGFTVGPFTSAVTALAFPALSYSKINVTAKIESPYEQTIRPFTTSVLTSPTYLKFNGLGFTEDSFELSSEQLPADMDEGAGACFGSMGGLWRPSRISVDVHEVYTGTDVAPFITIREYNKTNATYLTIDTLTAGYRSVGLGGNSAALGNDVLPTFPTTLFESWGVTPAPAYTDISRAKAPKWTLKIEGWRKRGGIWQ